MDKRFNKFVFKRSKELSYVIGALLGDGQIKVEKNHYQYKVRLRVKDKEFAEKFAVCMQKILQQKVPNKIFTELDRTRGNRRRFVASVSSKIFVKFLIRNKNNLLQFVRPYSKDFLQGFFDSEGFTGISTFGNFGVKVGLANTNLSLLKKINKILEEDFDIKSCIRMTMSKGTKVKIWGSSYECRKNVYQLMINKNEDVEKFCKRIGFNILRKQEKLKEALILRKMNLANASKIWKQNYMKIGREWVKRVDSGAFPEHSF